jgi:hypothetical protein
MLDCHCRQSQGATEPGDLYDLALNPLGKRTCEDAVSI